MFCAPSAPVFYVLAGKENQKIIKKQAIDILRSCPIPPPLTHLHLHFHSHLPSPLCLALALSLFLLDNSFRTKKWRRERDSNPRYRFQYNCLAGSPVQPLQHLSAIMAEEVGFEPTDLVKGQRFSRPPHSTTLPLLHMSLRL